MPPSAFFYYLPDSAKLNLPSTIQNSVNMVKKRYKKRWENSTRRVKTKMRRIEYVVSNERLITPSGLSLVGQVLGKSNLVKKANRMRTEKRSQPQIESGDILLTMIGLLSLGKSYFENVNEFHKDEEFYKIALGIAYGIPSESSLRNQCH